MLARQRHQLIEREVHEHGAVRVAELATRLQVTEETIRRDLDRLESQGILIRSHGGAVRNPEAGREDRETPHWFREQQHAAEKQAIARHAASLIAENETILLDASSTAWYVAQALPDIPLAVITNSCPVVTTLAQHKNVKVVCPGGALSPASVSFVGGLTVEFLGRFHADKAFVSGRALDFDRGLCDANEQQALVRTKMLEISDFRVGMIDASKIGRRALYAFAGLDRLNCLITDSRVPEPVHAQLGERIADIRVVDKDSESHKEAS